MPVTHIPCTARSPVATLAALFLAAACGGSEGQPGQPGESGESGADAPAAALPHIQSRPAADVLEAIEGALLVPPVPRSVEFEAVSEGAFAASLRGTLQFGEGNAVELEATGTFGPDSVSLTLSGADAEMTWGNGDGFRRDTLPPGLREGVAVGLVRMGILHNLARLTSGAAPDRTDGTVRSWAEAVEPVWYEGAPEMGAHGIAFGLRVAGQTSGRATLWLDAEGGLLGRDQVVEFPGGEMRVRERYVWGR